MKEFSKPEVDKSPFADLQRSKIVGSNSSFYDSPGKPALVIRKSLVPPALEHIPIGGEPNVTGILEEWRKDIAVLRKAAEECGIRMVKADAVVGHNPLATEESQPDDDISLFFVTERISGMSLDEFETFDSELSGKVDRVFQNFLVYLHKAYINHEDHWHDFKPEQIMYGTAPGEKTPELILVDIDPVIDSWEERVFDTENDLVNKEQNFWYYLKKIASHLVEFEKKCEGGLPHARHELERIISEMPLPKDETVLRFYKDVKDILAGTF